MSETGDWLRRVWNRIVAGGKAVPQGGESVTIGPNEQEREMSTNAQLGGSADEPWPGNE